MAGAPYTTIWAYPWDLLDQGADAAAARIREEMGLDAVSVATAYHSVAQLRPQSKAGRWYAAPEAAVYFRPDPSLYAGTRLRPRVSPLAQARDPLDEVCRAADARGLYVVAWTVCLHNSHLGRAHPECAVETVYGDVLTSDLCPANPDVRAYVCALARDLSSRYPLSALELESIGYGGRGHFHGHEKVGLDLGVAGAFLHGLCFCAHCRARAEARGVDVEQLRSEVRAELDRAFAAATAVQGDVEDVAARLSGLGAYLRVREETVTSLMREVRAASRSPLRVIRMGGWHRSGESVQALAAECECVEVLAYSAAPEQVQRVVRGALAELGENGSPDRLLVGLQAYPPHATDAAVLVANVAAAAQLGIRQFSFYNYGVMPEPCLAWVAEAVHAARAR